MNTVLVIDDEADIRELLRLTLTRMDLEVVEAGSCEEAKACLARQRFSLCLTDMRLPDGDGLSIVEHVQQQYSDLPIAVITAHGNVEAAVAALKAGAFDFIAKPVNLKVLRDLIKTAMYLHPSRTLDGSDNSALIGCSAAINRLREQITKLARSQAPVQIQGPSGVGKELVARLIHHQGPRADKPFVPVNCGAIPSELVESEFFGHKKGSFTGAVSDKEGLFQAADGGTLFLDEVADLPLAMQVKLLRAIQEKAVRAVGDQKERQVDVRILSATHQDLSACVAAGSFRQDLFYRINVIELLVPSLADRREDLPLLIEHILDQLAETHQTKKPTLSTMAVSALNQYPFPGNIRELENILERALTLCESDEIAVDDLQLNLSSAPLETLAPEEMAAEEQTSTGDLNAHLDGVEAERIRNALEKTRWNRTAAAKLLGISLRALRYRLQKLGIE